MPTRARSHLLEEQSIRRFVDLLPSTWVYRGKSPDYGIDGEVEIYDDGGRATGLAFQVQLRATDNAAHGDGVRLKVDQLNYFLSFDLPTAVVRYDNARGKFNWQWASNIASRTLFREKQKTFTYKFGEAEAWHDTTPAEVRRTLEVRRRLASYPPSMPIPLRVDLSSLPGEQHYLIDRAIARAIAGSRGALVKAASATTEVEVSTRLEPDLLTIGIDTIGSGTFELHAPRAEDYLASMLYGLVRLFRDQRLIRHAESLARHLEESGIAHHDAGLAFDACTALASDLPALVHLAVVNGLHEQKSPHFALLAYTIAKSPQDDKARRLATEAFFDATVTAARATGSLGEAAAVYSIGNFYRTQRETLLAIASYNRARKLRPAYFEAEYFLSELGGLLYVSHRYRAAAKTYWAAACRGAGSDDISFLLGDALLMAGFVAAARDSFAKALMECTAERILIDAELKVAVCDRLIEKLRTPIVPRRRAEADRMLAPDGCDPSAHLEHLLINVDAMHPVAHFNLGVMRSGEGDREAALWHFLICALVQPQDIEAWTNAITCALSRQDEWFLGCLLSLSIHHMGDEAYDHLRRYLVAQSASDEMLFAFDQIAMRLLDQDELSGDGVFTIRMLDGDGYSAIRISNSFQQVFPSLQVPIG